MNDELSKPLSDAQLRALRERNEQRAREAIATLGERYACHPAHSPHPPRRVLTQWGGLC